MRSSNRPPNPIAFIPAEPAVPNSMDREAPRYSTSSRAPVAPPVQPAHQPAPSATRDAPVLGPDGEPLPTWLQPFTAGMNARFTRTPDYLRRPRGPASEEEDVDAPEAAAPVEVVAETIESSVPEAGEPIAASVEALVELAPPPPPVEAAASEADAHQAEIAAASRPTNIRRLERLIQVGRAVPPPRAIGLEEAPVTAPRSPAADLAPGRVSRPVRPEPKAEAPAAPVPAEVKPEAVTAPVAAAPVATVPHIVAPILRTPETLLPGFVQASVQVWFEWPIWVTPVQSLSARSRETRRLRRESFLESAASEPVEAVPSQPAPTPSVAIVPDSQPAPVRAETVVSFHAGEYELPPLELLAEPPVTEPPFELSAEYLDQNSTFLQQTLRDFGVRGEIIDANPGPVVTLYELEPAPGTKSSRVIGLSGDIARSMSAVSARVAVVEGRNVIGIELPNQTRETVWLRELMASQDFAEAKAKLGLCLGKTIGGEPVIADLARMPHLLVAGTTGSGKSVAINTMILSLLYRHRPEECRLIMIDPKMLELSVYEGIPHLLTPVVTDPKKAVTALKWAVREMEERYRKMSRLGVRNIDGFNVRVAEARANGEVITRTIDTGFDRTTGEMTQEEQVMDLTHLPFIVVIIDEMADLMMVAGKEIESAVQRLAQMARAAGIHLVMATQRPSVDVITGTIKANFPTRISFQVTSKIDSRTILGEMGAEQLLGQGDMLYMAGGGRITRVHGPFVSDLEVEHVVAHLKRQGRPEYLDAVTASDEEADEAAPAEEDVAVFDKSSMGEEGGDAYEQAVAVVLRDRKASTSYIQRRLQVGYNRAASIMERMEQEGIVGPANHAGKREIFMER
ncbi:DNA translocase FtsK [Kaistia defluvii]|uniref:DNA translocase FtsK n=1 Tax=Kaistia defluvii TaxID=410841 RepID=UPI00225785AD|nr:DNA translocase FtsK [Kaistia defluvii]MCX5521219.1 DNA translocase FtsK [Kaistia defluvii]